MAKKKKEQKVAPEQQAPASAPEAASQQKLDFDAWWALRGKKLPKHHHKEIIKADFAGRGLDDKESMEDFDRALEMYGVKLD